jgi:general secretion pathway protein G
MTNKRMVSARGFTLIEVLLVIGILLVLGTVAVVAYPRIKESADKNTTKIMINETCHAIDIYQTALSRYPATDEGLKALVEPPSDEKLLEKWKSGMNGGPYLKDGKIPVDPWGGELQYELVQTSGSSGAVATGPAYHVWSNGADGQSGTEDDVRNWTESK